MTPRIHSGLSFQGYGMPGIPGGPGRLPVYIGRTGIGPVGQVSIPTSYIGQCRITCTPAGLPQPTLSGSQPDKVFIRIIHLL